MKCLNVNGKIGHLLKHYSDDNITNSRRGDFIVPYLDSCQGVIDFTTVDPYLNSVSSATENSLSKAEKEEYSLSHLSANYVKSMGIPLIKVIGRMSLSLFKALFRYFDSILKPSL
ncbi:hypothetical protein GEMRC1_004279 [Eukaryota sp. GEM-RC1]